MTILDTIPYKGLTIKILPDSDVESPLEADCMPRFAFWHRRYKNPAEEYPGPEAVFRAVKQGAVAFPVRVYEHSAIAFTVTRGATYPFNDQWDSGFAGFLVYPPELLKEVGDPSPEGLAKEAEGIMEEYTAYSNGWGYGFVIENAEGEELDSCWGYLDQDYCLESAKAAADYHAQEGAA